MKEFKKVLLGLACMGVAVLGFGAQVKANSANVKATFSFDQSGFPGKAEGDKIVSFTIENADPGETGTEVGEIYAVQVGDGTIVDLAAIVSEGESITGDVDWTKANLRELRKSGGAVPDFKVFWKDTNKPAGDPDEYVILTNITQPTGFPDLKTVVVDLPDNAPAGVAATIAGKKEGDSDYTDKFFEGESVAISYAGLPAEGKDFEKWDDGNTDKSRTIIVDADDVKNKYKGVLKAETVEVSGVPTAIISELRLNKELAVKLGGEDISVFTEWTAVLSDFTDCTSTDSTIDLSDSSFYAKLNDGKNSGSMKLTVTAPNGNKAEFIIKVVKPVVTITGNDKVTVGSTTPFKAVVGNPDGVDVLSYYEGLGFEAKIEMWVSEKTAVADIKEKSGQVAIIEGKGKGESTITAMATYGDKPCVDGTKKITVDEVAVTKITITPASKQIYKNEKVTLLATVEPADYKGAITWDLVGTGANKVVSMTPAADGKSVDIVGLALGSVTVQATAGGKTAIATIDVISNGKSKVEFNPSKVTIGIGTKISKSNASASEVIEAGGYGPIEVSVTPASATLTDLFIDSDRSTGDLLTFSSSDRSKLYVIGLKKGTVYLVGKTSDDGTGECVITIDENAVTSFEIEDVKVTKGFTVPIITHVKPENAAKNGYKFELSSKGQGYAKIVAYTTDSMWGVTGLANVSNVSLTGYVNGTSASANANVTVYTTPTITYDKSSGSLSCSLPAGVFTGADATKNLETVTGGYIVATYGGNEVWNSGDTYTTKGSNFTVGRDALQSMVESIKGKLSGDTATITMTLYPVGKSVSGAGGVRNTDISDASTKTEVVAYKVQVNGENITSATYYGIPGASMKVTATPISGATFTKWSDDSTANPRTITVSDDIEKNKFSAVATAKNSTTSSTAKKTINGKAADGLDDVPKTGEGHEVWILWAVLLATAVFGFFAYRKLRPNAAIIGKKKDNDKESK